MARRSKASAGDIAEIASDRASASDKREAGFVKSGGRLVPGKRTPRAFKSAFKRSLKRGKGGPTKRRKMKRRH